MIEIPLTSSPEQLFSSVISGETYDIRVLRNSRNQIWTISFRSGSTSIVEGIPLVAGLDIVRQFPIGIKNMYIINSDDTSLDPIGDSIGDSARLVILTEEEVSGG